MRSPFASSRATAGILLWLLACTAQAYQVLEGRVVKVADGDTITVLSSAHEQQRIRLAEIDAPEKSQAFGQRSKQSLSDLVFAKTVRVEVVDTDRYGRFVGQVFVGAEHVNHAQVRRGMAWAYRRYLKDPAVLALEEEARAARRGLWADPAPTPPWEFRHAARNSRE